MHVDMHVLARSLIRNPMYNDYNRRERVAALALSAFCAATRERRVALRPGGGADAPGAPHAHVRARVE